MLQCIRLQLNSSFSRRSVPKLWHDSCRASAGRPDAEGLRSTAQRSGRPLEGGDAFSRISPEIKFKTIPASIGRSTAHNRTINKGRASLQGQWIESIGDLSS